MTHHAADAILVLNCGSSSVKFRVFDTNDERELARGAVEGIGAAESVVEFSGAGEAELRERRPVADHAAALGAACDWLDASGCVPGIVAHRVVHGGDRFAEAVVIDDAVVAEVDRFTPLAPLHNPANLVGVRLARQRYPAARHVAAFDTAFHQTIPPYAAAYALPREVAHTHRLRRYGFHGASHRWAASRAAELVGQPLIGMRTVVLHLGAGASASAVLGGRSIDTSMGLTPLEGLVMATRSGDLDPGVILYLQREVGMSTDDVDRMLNRSSGLVGLCGTADMREALRRAAVGDPRARAALELYVRRIVREIGALTAVLGGLDALVFTAGVGERSPEVRRRVAERLGVLGVRLDEEANEAGAPPDRVINAEESGPAVLVVAANEELQIAQEAVMAAAV